jgi:hypothetical protein
LVSVYRIRERGLKLPRPKHPAQGHLLVGVDEISYRTKLRARLVDEKGTEVLPALLDAQLVKVTGNGIVLRGIEVIARRMTRKSATDHYMQTWWVMVHTAEMPE